MKKFLLAILMAIPLIACSKPGGKVSLTFGSYSDNDVIELTDATIDGKLASENMLIVSYKEGTSCSCWHNFHRDVLLPNITKNHLRVYSIYTKYITDELVDKGFQRREDAPVLYIVKDGKVDKKFKYEDSYGFYTSETAFYNQIQIDCNLPKMFYCSKEYIDEEIAKDQQTSIFIMRTSCGDCKQAIPNILTPYFSTHEGNLLTLDMDLYMSDTTLYDEVKAHFHLTAASDTVFGYDTGFVPTLQIWNNGELKDACVYLNDKTNEDKTKVIRSYYTTERSSVLPFLANVNEEDRVIMNRDIPEEYKEKVGQFFINCHAPIINGFLKTYFPN